MRKDKIDLLFGKLEGIWEQLLSFSPDKNHLREEIPEQLMALHSIQSNDSVLELGGSIGRNSFIINSLLKDKSKHVVIEPSTQEISELTRNKTDNNLDFSIENVAISKKPLFGLS